MRWSDELLDLIEGLTSKQRSAIPRIVARRAEGGSLTSMLRGPEKVCAWRTYYKKPSGWSHNEAWLRALEMAQREYNARLLDQAVDRAVDNLRLGTEAASAFLLEEVRAGRRLQWGDEDDLGLAQKGLLLLLRNGEDKEKIRAATALARMCGGQLERALRAGLGILDRADIKTAMKASTGADQFADWITELRGLDDDETVADVGAEAGDVQAVGV